ncbi:MAG: TetR/AcrR family transcriptional regulator [Actinobacteria bacterium]|nr:TetR/AcrR family transcriptional regulator [Actinomycetota bacterium]
MAEETRAKLVEAARATLAQDGMAATSARTIGTRAGVNPALIYYHFDSLTSLLAEVSRTLTAERAATYRQRLAPVGTLTELAVVARGLHREEHASGNLAVLAQLLAGSRAHPELATILHDNFDLLASEVTSTLERILSGTALDGLLDTHQVARAVSAGFIGIELLDSVSGTDDPALFDTLDTITVLVDLILNAGTISNGLLRRRLSTVSNLKPN